MKIAYIAHPISGDVKGNLEKIRQITREINMSEPDVVPFAPYWLDCHALDDTVPEERERGIRNDHELFARGFIDELRIYGDIISSGMAEEIVVALSMDIPVKPMTKTTSELFKLKFDKTEPCPSCEGKGVLPGSHYDEIEPCGTCGGVTTR